MIAGAVLAANRAIDASVHKTIGSHFVQQEKIDP